MVVLADPRDSCGPAVSAPLVAIVRIREHNRSKVICDAWEAGLARAGVRTVSFYESEWDNPNRRVELLGCSHVVFYGLEGNVPLIFRLFATDSNRRAIYVDLGYWGRREGGRFSGYHKVVVNGRHPTAYFRKPQHGRARIAAFRELLAQPWDYGGHHILLAGMGDKGALAEGFHPEEWERQAIDIIKGATDRPIVYRAKPSWKKARPILGCLSVDSKARPVELDLANCWAVVTHHSNVAVDGLVAGVPAFCWAGVAAPFSSQKLEQIERPEYPDGRDAWMADIAYTQWTPNEMADGACWAHLRAEGLV
jgi:hypothetical protein